MTSRRQLLLAVCGLALAGPASSELREERNKRDRRERAENEREWKRKYEEEWKAYLSEQNRPYQKWNYTKRRDKLDYQAYRKAHGQKPLPLRFF